MVAIVAVLVAIAIPIFSSRLEAAQEATCLANRTSAAHTLTAGYLTEGDTRNAEEILKDAMGVDATVEDDGVTVTVSQGLCSADGTITLTRNERGAYSATCSTHGTTTGSFSSPEDLMTIEALIKGVHVGTIDSNAAVNNPSSYAAQISATLAEQGFDLLAMGATTWQYVGTGSSSFFYWSTVDISGLADSTKTPVMRYNFSTGTYTVWIAEVKTKSSSTATASYNGYSTKFTGYAPSTNSGKENQTYDQMVKHFKDALVEYPSA